MKGCLTRDETGAYLLQTQRSGKVKLDSVEDLSSRVGRQIKITGTFEDTQPGSSAASAVNGSNSNPSERPHSVRAFRIFKVDVLSQTCTGHRK